MAIDVTRNKFNLFLKTSLIRTPKNRKESCGVLFCTHFSSLGACDISVRGRQKLTKNHINIDFFNILILILNAHLYTFNRNVSARVMLFFYLADSNQM